MTSHSCQNGCSQETLDFVFMGCIWLAGLHSLPNLSDINVVYDI